MSSCEPPEKLTAADRSPLMVSPDKVLDDIDKGLAKRKRLVVLGGRAMHALRRFSPAVVWRIAGIVGA